jgi:hypothetical protein
MGCITGEGLGMIVICMGILAKCGLGRQVWRSRVISIPLLAHAMSSGKPERAANGPR